MTNSRKASFILAALLSTGAVFAQAQAAPADQQPAAQAPAGGGMHGSFSRADTWNFMAARGPDFRERYTDDLPANNADIGITIARLLQLQLLPKGKLSGRVLTESLRGHDSDPLPGVEFHTQVSDRSFNGLTTILHTQTVGGYTYYDDAGFIGRTVGLESKSR